MNGKQLIVVGGGAAGFFCAVNAARMYPGLQVTILEKSGKILSKVKVSGGGRCNVTHACFDITEMSRRYPRGSNFVKKCFHDFFTTDTIKWFEQRGVKLKEEADGRMFPVTDSSQSVIDCLMNEASLYGVNIELNTGVKAIAQEKAGWQLLLDNDRTRPADFVCIATGGYPKASMFDWLEKTGHQFEAPVPSLFTFNMPGHAITRLMGVSVAVARVRVAGTKLDQEGPLLITHWGMSGPAVLKLSAWGARELQQKNYTFTILVSWVPSLTEPELRERLQQARHESASHRVSQRNFFGLPQRLWEFLLEHSFIKAETRWADLSSKDQNKLIKNLVAGEFEVRGKTTFKEEFVTAGGIRLTEVDHKTMMSRKHANLFFAGEVLDVDGITGGYNFQHAWTSGYIAAKLGQGENDG